MTDNVVPFPGVKRNSPPQNLEEVQSNLETIRQVHIEEAMNLVATVVFDNLLLAGFSFDPDDDSMIKDVALMLESLRSLLSKYHNLEHPFHRVANEIFALQKNGTVICLESKLEKLCEEEKV